MGNGRRWTEAEDRTIERATFETLEHGALDFRPHEGDCAGRLERLSQDLGRTCVAVRKRAQRLGAASYRPRGKEDAS